MLKIFVWVLSEDNGYILEVLMSVRLLIFLVVAFLRGMLATFLVAVMKFPSKAIPGRKELHWGRKGMGGDCSQRPSQEAERDAAGVSWALLFFFPFESVWTQSTFRVNLLPKLNHSRKYLHKYTQILVSWLILKSSEIDEIKHYRRIILERRT